MFYRLIVDGVYEDVLIKAPNRIIANDIALTGVGRSQEVVAVEHIEESDIDFEMAATFQIWEKL